MAIGLRRLTSRCLALMLPGLPWLEAVTDSRWWAHLQDDLAAETAKLEQLQTLQTCLASCWQG